MATTQRQPDRIALATDLVNSWDEYPAPRDYLDLSWLRRWLTQHGLEPAARRVSAKDVERARAWRDAIASAFDADSEQQAVAILNRLVAELGTPPQLERHDGDWEFRSWPSDPVRLETAVVMAASGLLETIRSRGWEGFGRCAADPCRCVYVDRSRNRSRRYCCELCADRIAQANYRRRGGK